jgi:16S rRNA (guanine966-N2)-methyltransferase
VPAGARPTSGRVREALFSLLGHDLTGWRVLDGFGGSGLLALEAWSRGASVVCVEKRRAAARVIRANAAGLGADIEVVVADLLRFDGDGFDAAVLDPPYALDPTPFLAHVATRVQERIVLEGPASRPDVGAPGLAVATQRCYGDTLLTVFEPVG